MNRAAALAAAAILAFGSRASFGLDDVQSFLAQGADGAVVLSWENPAGADYAGVVIRRSTTGYPADVTDGEPVGPFPTGDFPVSQTSYVDDGLANGFTYYYTAFAHDNLMNPAAGVTASASTVQAVTNFQATSGDHEIALSWNMPTDATPNFVGVIVRRSTEAYPQTVSEGDWLVTVGAQPDPIDYASYVDTDVVPLSVRYYYSAFSHYYFAPPVDADVYGPPVSVDQVADDLTPPAEIQNFAAVSGEDLYVPLTWDNPPFSEDWARVVVCRSTADDIMSASDGTIVRQIVRPMPPDDPDGYPSFETYDDTTVINDQTYYYSVFVLDEAGNESAPASAQATPVDDTPPDAPQLVAQPVILTPWPGGLQAAVRLSWSVDDMVEPNLDLYGVVILRADWFEGEVPADPYPTDPWDDRTNILWVGWYGSYDQIDDPCVEVGVTYYYAAWALDDESPPNVSARATAEATPVLNFPPIIWNVWATPSGPPHEALIEWTVQDLDASLCEVSYGTTTGYYLGTVREDAYSVETGRSAVLDGLWGGTTIYFRIVAIDDKGASSTYEDSFDTTLDSSEDTDGDGMADDWEVEHFGDTWYSDGLVNSDWDGLLDLDEYRYGTDPNSTDTDGDGVADDVEIANGSDPRTRPPVPLGPGKGCGSPPGGASPGTALAALALALAALRRAWNVR